VKKLRAATGVAAGIALFLLARRIGLSNLASQLRHLGVVLPIVLATGCTRLLLQTRAWSIALRAEGIALTQSRLFAVRLASQAAGYLIALGPVVSEPAKLALLRHPGGMAAAAPATLFETGAYWFTSVILGLAGACAGALLLAHAKAVWVAAAIFSAGLWLLTTRRCLLTPVVLGLGPRAPEWLRSAEQVERRIRSFRERQPRAARKIVALECVAQTVTLVEVAAVCWAVGIHSSLVQALTIEAAGRVTKVFGAWVPGRIGVDEGGAAASFALLGFSPAVGLMLALARRVRDLVWCSAGVLWTAGASDRAPMPVAAPHHPSLCTEEN
jgi:hypothetical protein